MDRDIIKKITVLNQYKKGINDKNNVILKKPKKKYYKKKVINQYKKGRNDKIFILFWKIHSVQKKKFIFILF